jgi:16S rRNA (guanine966-N2)-methyltransferase
MQRAGCQVNGEFEMRVIAGTARGMKLKAPKGMQVRPTADRVKEALFSILGSRIPGACFIDLYAGSGAIGIEALSRGAEYCIFVENKRTNIALIKENITKTGLVNKTRVICADAIKTMKSLALENIKADLLFMDPPYEYINIGTIVDSVLELSIVSESGLIVAEHAFSNRQWADKFISTRQKKYGDTCLTFIPIGNSIRTTHEELHPEL